MKEFNNKPANPGMDKVFVDQAWGNMEALLDKEMPVEEKRKKAIVWWWLFPLLLLGGIVSWGYLNFSGEVETTPIKSAPAKTEQEYKGPIATAPQNSKQTETIDAINSTNTNTTVTNKLVDTQEQISKTKTTIPSTFPVASYTNTLSNTARNNELLSNNPSNTFTIFNKSNSPSFEEKTDVLQQAVKQVVKPSLVQSSIPQKQTAIPSTIVKEASVLHKIMPFQPIQPLSLASVKFENEIPILSIEEPEITKHRRKVKVGISAHANLAYTESLGASIGAHIDIPIAKRFSLLVEPEFTHMMHKTNWSLVTSSNDVAFIDNNDQVSIPDSLGLATLLDTLEYIIQYNKSNSSLKSKLNYLRLPVSLAWNISRKFSLSAGMDLGFLLNKSKLDRIAIEKAAVQDPTLQFAEFDQIQNTFTFRRIDPAFSVGMRFFASNKLGFNLKYRHGFKKLIANNSSDINAQLQVGLLYRFNGG